MTHNKPFSWKSLLIAPMVIPLLCTMLFFLLAPPARVPQTFLETLTFYSIILGIGCFISYGAVYFLLFPALFIASRFVALNARVAALTGLAAGMVVYWCYLWVWYRSSGPDSGPPIGTFLEFVMEHGNPIGWDGAFVLGAGLVTAILYWVMLGRRQSDNPPSINP